MTIKVHLSRIRKNAFGGTTTGTLCNRLRMLSDGMNIAATREEVTCSFCLREMARQDKRAASNT